MKFIKYAEDFDPSDNRDLRLIEEEFDDDIADDPTLLQKLFSEIPDVEMQDPGMISSDGSDPEESDEEEEPLEMPKRKKPRFIDDEAGED